MRFHSSRMEALASGDPCAKHSGFDAAVRAHGSFTGRIKRTGMRTHTLGCLDLYLVETAAGAQEQLAVCYADESASAPAGRALVFPLIKGHEFGDVKRHGPVLTLQATRYSLVLECLGDLDEENDGGAASPGQWARILSRLISSSGRGLDGGRALARPSQASYFDGLGINVQPVHHDAPASPPATAYSPPPSIPASASNSSMSRARQLVPAAMQSAGSAHSLAGSAGSAMAKSRSLKRISLLLSSDMDNGFGDDLKTILTKMDELQDPPAQDPLQTFELPAAPFNEGTDSDFSSTPSPTSLYLQPDTSSSSLNSPENSTRLDSILAKEQRQYVEKYGTRAATLSDYYHVGPHGADHPADAAARLPPQMPAPVPEIKVSSDRAAESLSGEPLSTASERRSTSSKSRTGDAKARSGDAKATAGDAKAITGDAKATAGDAKATTENTRPTTENSTTAAAKNTPSKNKKKAKYVSIAQDIQVINDNDAAGQDTTNDTPRDAPSPGPKHPFSPTPADSPATAGRSNERKFSKVVKRFLGKRKQSKSSLAPASALPASPLPSPNNSTEALVEPTLSSPLNFAESDAASPAIASPAIASPHTDSSQIDSRQPDSPPADSPAHDQPKHHHYLNLAGQVTVSPPRDKASAAAKPDEGSSAKAPADKPAAIVVTATNNGGRTAAVPNSASITALSFRSLSSKSLSMRSMSSSSLADDTNNTTISDVDTPSKPSIPSTKQAAPPAKSSGFDLDTDSSSPTLLRRESRDELGVAPIKLDIDALSPPPPSAARKMYESGNKSTSALQPSKSSSFSSFSSSKRSLNSYSSASSTSSAGASTMFRKGSPCLFSANMWASVWSTSKWTPLSQLELPLEIIVSESASLARVLVNGGASVNFKVTPECEIRKVSHHDVEVKSPDATYMFRARDPENAQRFYRMFWNITMNGVQPVLAALISNNPSAGLFDDDDLLAGRRRTLMPPALSKSNPNLNLSYMGRLTSTIIEE